ncbi:hypothetical protein R3P38DRAFT_3343883 [Favolaschia claudopus]|uniref:Uncharacterized protein n=1 Tax=Favolaschia claudopus TaxID=2862362 RepID=A0AAW0DG10_9AGAR
MGKETSLGGRQNIEGIVRGPATAWGKDLKQKKGILTSPKLTDVKKNFRKLQNSGKKSKRRNLKGYSAAARRSSGNNNESLTKVLENSWRTRYLMLRGRVFACRQPKRLKKTREKHEKSKGKVVSKLCAPLRGAAVTTATAEDLLGGCQTRCYMRRGRAFACRQPKPSKKRVKMSEKGKEQIIHLKSRLRDGDTSCRRDSAAALRGGDDGNNQRFDGKDSAAPRRRTTTEVMNDGRGRCFTRRGRGLPAGGQNPGEKGLKRALETASLVQRRTDFTYVDSTLNGWRSMGKLGEKSQQAEESDNFVEKPSSDLFEPTDRAGFQSNPKKSTNPRGYSASERPGKAPESRPVLTEIPNIGFYHHHRHLRAQDFAALTAQEPPQNGKTGNCAHFRKSPSTRPTPTEHDSGNAGLNVLERSEQFGAELRPDEFSSFRLNGSELRNSQDALSIPTDSRLIWFYTLLQYFAFSPVIVTLNRRAYYDSLQRQPSSQIPMTLYRSKFVFVSGMHEMHILTGCARCTFGCPVSLNLYLNGTHSIQLTLQTLTWIDFGADSGIPVSSSIVAYSAQFGASPSTVNYSIPLYTETTVVYRNYVVPSAPNLFHYNAETMLVFQVEFSSSRVEADSISNSDTVAISSRSSINRDRARLKSQFKSVTNLSFNSTIFFETRPPTSALQPFSAITAVSRPTLCASCQKHVNLNKFFDSKVTTETGSGERGRVGVGETSAFLQRVWALKGLVRREFERRDARGGVGTRRRWERSLSSSFVTEFGASGAGVKGGGACACGTEGMEESGDRGCGRDGGRGRHLGSLCPRAGVSSEGRRVDRLTQWQRRAPTARAVAELSGIVGGGDGCIG